MQRQLAILACTLLLALALTACGNSAEPPNPDPLPTVTGLPDQPAEQVATPEGNVAPGGEEGYPAPDSLAPTPLPEGYPAPDSLAPTPLPEGYPAPTPAS